MKKIDFSMLTVTLKKYRLLVLAAGLLILSLSQHKLVMPLIYDVIKSDAFLVDSKDKGSNAPISTPLSQIAFTHCNRYMKDKAAEGTTLGFAEQPLKAWDIGNHQYIINAEIKVTHEGKITDKKYVCRITYDKGDNEEDALNFESWSVIGVSGL